MSDYNKDRLGKIVALAKHGVAGEKENAIRMVKSICIRYGLDFDAVMENVEIGEYTFEYSNTIEKALLPQILQKFCKPYPDQVMDILFSQQVKKMWIKTTKEKYVEGLNAWDVLRKLYKVEQEKVLKTLLFAFLDKHDLYHNPTEEEKKRLQDYKEDPEEMELRIRGRRMASSLEDAKLFKRLGDGGTK